jgi:nitroreductase
MVRAFRPDPIPSEVLDRVLAVAPRAPSAGNAQGTELVVLEGPEQTARYWDVTLPSGFARDNFTYPKLLEAPVLVLPLARAGAYLERYSETDKAFTGLGESEERWPVPYWTIDTSFAVMLLLLAATDAGLGSLFFGIFDKEPELMSALGVPDGVRPIGTIALGYRDEAAERPGRSANRPRRDVDAITHRGGW